MKILVACEESQAVTIELRRLGHEAYSCDIQECSGGHPKWHIKNDVLKFLNPTILFINELPGIQFFTMDNEYHCFPGKWDMIIAHPPCTYLAVTGKRWFNVERYGEKAIQRKKDREDAIKFFMAFANADCDKIAIENPVGVMSSLWRKPDQYIEPYMFGDQEKKKTGLWLKGLPLLKPTNIVEPTIIHCKSGANEPRWHMETMHLSKEERSRVRSKTFHGIARAMAEQWAGPVKEA